MDNNQIGLFHYHISQYIHHKWISQILMTSNEETTFGHALSVIKNWTHEIATNPLTLKINDQRKAVLIQKKQGPVRLNAVLFHIHEPKQIYSRPKSEICTHSEADVLDLTFNQDISFTVSQYIVDRWVKLITLDKQPLEENHISRYMEKTLLPNEGEYLELTNGYGIGIVTGTDKYSTRMIPSQYEKWMD